MQAEQRRSAPVAVVGLQDPFAVGLAWARDDGENYFSVTRTREPEAPRGGSESGPQPGAGRGLHKLKLKGRGPGPQAPTPPPPSNLKPRGGTGMLLKDDRCAQTATSRQLCTLRMAMRVRPVRSA